jgi:hypothetical protein
MAHAAPERAIEQWHRTAWRQFHPGRLRLDEVTTGAAMDRHLQAALDEIADGDRFENRNRI